MEHDLIATYLKEKISFAHSRINNYIKDIKELEEEISSPVEFLDNEYTKSYFVCKSAMDKIPEEKNIWCKDNIGYLPICLFVEPHNSDEYRMDDRHKRKMVVLFKCDEDLTAYKLNFS